MNELERHKTSELLDIISTHPKEQVVLVEGARQVGKTTLVRMALGRFGKPFLEINLEKQLLHKAAINNCQDFSEFCEWLSDDLAFTPNGSQILFIDEAQESETLGRFVRNMAEDWPKTHVILSGSMMSRLFRGDVRYPVGRVKPFVVCPMTFCEFLLATGKDTMVKTILGGLTQDLSERRHTSLLELLDQYLLVGGLPAIVRDFLKNTSYTTTRKELYEGYRNDFLRVFGEDQSYLYHKALQAVADHVGSLSTLSQIIAPQDSAYRSLPTVLSRLEAWHMIHESLQRGPFPEGTTLYHPKRYLFDMGLLSDLRTLAVPFLSVLGSDNPTHRTVLGGIMENFVAIHLAFLGYSLAGYKKGSAGMEIDFVIKHGNQTIPIECKANLKTKDTHLKGLRTYLQEYNLPLGIVVNADQFAIRKYPTALIIVLPFYAIEVLPKLLLLHTVNRT